MKIAPIHTALRKHGNFDPIFVHTGQHYDWEMSEVFLRDLGLPPPDYELDVGSGSHAYQTASVMLRLEPVLLEHSPDLVIVVGDVNSTLGAALSATQSGIPVAHVEAGLRSFDPTMPEELNRRLTDAVSDWLFAPSPDAVLNLKAEGFSSERIHFVGNVMIDTLDRLLPRARTMNTLEGFGLRPRKYILATLHRPSNVDAEDSLRQACAVLAAASRFGPVVLSTHPRTRKRLDETGMKSILGDRVTVMDPLGYLEFLCLMHSARAILTDSGGVQEEAAVLGVPCLTMRANTERPITITAGTNRLVGLDVDRVDKELDSVFRGHAVSGRRPPLWDGRAAERIVAVLEQPPA